MPDWEGPEQVDAGFLDFDEQEGNTGEEGSWFFYPDADDELNFASNSFDSNSFASNSFS